MLSGETPSFAREKFPVRFYDFASYRKPRNYRLIFTFKVFLCLFNREHNLVHRFGESLVCNAGICVLLMNGCLYAELTGRSDNGTADISAEAYYNVRFKFFDYFFRPLSMSLS